jgi:hypothetical protein
MDRPNTPDNNGRDGARERRMGNLILLGVVAVIIGIAYWLANSMLDQRAIDDCAAQGRRNCAPIAGATDQR